MLKASQSFAEAKQKKDFVQNTTAQLEHYANPYLDDMVNRLKELVATSQSFAELQTKILEQFDDLAHDELVKVMELAFTLAELKGRSEI